MKTTKETRVVLELELHEHMLAQTKKAGISNSKYIARLVAADMAKPIVLGVILRGMAVEKALLSCKTWWVARDYYYEKSTARKRVFWKDGWIWLVGKTANGSSKQAEQLIECTEVLFDGAKDDEYQLKHFTQAVANWNELKAAPDIELAGDDVFKWGSSFYESIGIGSDSRISYFCHRNETLAAIAEAKRALELENEAIAQEVITVPPMPTNEEVVITTELTSDSDNESLTKAELKARFGLDEKQYNDASSVGKAGWRAPDGQVWQMRGSKTNRSWTRASVEAVQLVLAIV